MRTLASVLATFLLVLHSLSSMAVTANSGEQLVIQDLKLTIPSDWKLQQDAKDNGTIILGFSSEDEYLTLYVKQQTGLDMKTIFANDATIVEDVKPAIFNSIEWNLLRTSKQFTAKNTTYHVSSFLTEIDGHTYYGYTRSSDETRSIEIVEQFLTEINR